MKSQFTLRLRIFKCLQKYYFEFNRKKDDILVDELRELLSVFKKGGIECIKNINSRGNLNHYPNNIHDEDHLNSSSKELFSEIIRREGTTIKNGAMPFGFQRTNPNGIQVVPTEATVVYYIFHEFVKSESISATRHGLISLGIRDFDWDRIIRILKNKSYAGLTKYASSYLNIFNNEVAFIDQNTFFKAQELLKVKSELANRTAYLLSRLITINNTNKYLIGTLVKKKSGLKFHYYFGKGNQNEKFYIETKILEENFEAFIKSKLDALSHIDYTNYFIEFHLKLLPTMKNCVEYINTFQGDTDEIYQNDLFLLKNEIEYFIELNNYVHFAKDIIINFWGLWSEGDIISKREMIFILFPYGLNYDQDQATFNSSVDFMGRLDQFNIGNQNPNYTF